LYRTSLYCIVLNQTVVFYTILLRCTAPSALLSPPSLFLHSLQSIPLYSLLSPHPSSLLLSPLLDWFKAGKGPDPVAASLDRDMDAYFNSKAAAAAAGGDVVADATITVDVVAVAAN
jgi:hypothetical protein